MMAMPFAVVGAIAGGLFYTYWRAQKQINQHNKDSGETTSQENELKQS